MFLKGNLTVSVIMPAYNAQKFISEAIESVLKQTFTNFELLVSDDASRDETLSVIESFRDPRIRIFRNSHNLGIFRNLNRLSQEATGEFIKIFCNDDVMCPECLDRQVAFMREHPDLGFCCLKSWPDRPHYRFLDELPTRIYPEASDLYFLTFGCIPDNLSTVILRRELLLALGGFREDLPYAGDFEMWQRMGSRFAFGIQRENLVFVRRHAETASNLLNRKNELIAQLDRAVGEMYERNRHHIGWIEKLHLSLIFEVQQIHVSIKRLLTGDVKSFLRIFRKRQHVFSLWMCAILWLVSLNRRLFYPWTTRHMLRICTELNSQGNKGCLIWPNLFGNEIISTAVRMAHKDGLHDSQKTK